MHMLILEHFDTGRFHPCFFSEAPFPGSQQPHGFVRLRSRGHHTEGFATVEEATAYMREFCAENGFTFHPEVMLWDGEPGITTLIAV